MRWLLLVLLFPLLEISVFMDVGEMIGVLPTLLLTVGSAVWGITMVRLQGIGTLSRMQQTMASGETPAFEMIEGSILMIAGVFLLIPGFITDSLGILLLIPPLRRALALKLFSKPNNAEFSMHSSHIQFDSKTPNNPNNPNKTKNDKGRTIDQDEPWE